MAIEQTRLDRELGELLQELRVLLPGVQVLLAFLLTAPFSARFVDITDAQRAGYFAALLCAAAATALLMAPTTYHRIRFRERDKERMLHVGNRCILAGTVLLAASVSIALYVVTDFLFDGTASALVAAAAAAVYIVLWYGIPLARHARDRDDGEPAGDDARPREVRTVGSGEPAGDGQGRDKGFS